MNIRKISIVAALLLIVAAIALSNMLGSRSKEKAPAKSKTSSKASSSAPKLAILEVKNRDIEANVELTGRLVSPDKVELYAEVSGVLLGGSQAFKEGNRFARGAVLLQIDQEETRLNLLAQKSTLLNNLVQMMPDLKLDYPESYPAWQSYLEGFKVEKPLKDFPETKNEQLRYFLASKGIYNQLYSIRSQEARLRKFIITAPFSGVVTEANINPGTLVRQGQKLGEFINPYRYELAASLALKDLEYVPIGAKITLSSEDLQGTWQGTVRRLSDKLDPNTQTLKVFIEVQGKGLKEGMFLRGDIASEGIDNVCPLPRDIIRNQNEVFVIDAANTLRRQQVKVLRYRGNEALVSGLKDGTKVLLEGINDAYEGMKIN